MAHPELQSIRQQLLQIHDHILNFKPLTARPPILDSSYEFTNEATEENQWLHQENIPGLKKLKESIRVDLGVLDKFLEGPNCANMPPLSTNAPYLLAVWNEVVSAPPPTVSIFKTFHIGLVEKVRKRTEQGQAGVKVDVVAENGRRWIRVNTVKNSRILSEFREIDSYLTDSDDDDDDLAKSQWDNIGRPSLAQKEFDNSILRMGRSLLKAAEANPIDGTTGIPRITLRLTRLNPTANEDGSVPDPRIAQTVNILRDMGVDIQLGERPSLAPALHSLAPTVPQPASFTPTPNINLDLSVLIALISDLTHAPLPRTIEEANRRFVPPQEYREWKQRRQVQAGKAPNGDAAAPDAPLETDINDLPRDLITHARALTNQLLQEMSAGLLQELHTRIAATGALAGVSFWTTAEARERCLRIVAKIGGVYEKRRARALFCLAPDGEASIPLAEAQRLYWQDSRFAPGFIALLPIQIYTAPSPGVLALADPAARARRARSPFGAALSHVCTDILAQETLTAPSISGAGPLAEIQRAAVTKANPRLTAHTVQSMRWGAELGWTTLTANRSSVKAVLRELKAARVAGRLVPDGAGAVDVAADRDGVAAIWIVDPRSLAEGMSSVAPGEKA
ncbi:hypothetical protein HYPSUDRAFT_190699 [Hypholoma sublateritium FD-334 SS-4]|uniref:DUF1308 domain-containing protein n=1 Tax=Hypholoma sublateritium (strain FD-334 SS-4) TaxID=945553 RepID=A0A0D2M6E6_HYPSF|nr:hypothetical protein HYPSUDRAFT_190699 [Hypholoma sublateritium FD-334 SS-4]